MTFDSYGSEFVGDPGPTATTAPQSATTWSAGPAASVIRVAEKPKKKSTKSARRLRSGSPPSASRQAGRQVLATTSDPYNRTCLRDRTYVAAVIKRCVYYDTAVDALVVVDSIWPRSWICADQRWQIPNGGR